MEGHVEDGLVELFSVRRDLLHARLALQVPEADAAVVTAGQQVETVGVDGQAGDGVQMGDHRVRQFAAVVVVETYVSVLVGRDCQRQSRMRDDAVNLPAEDAAVDALVRV